VELLGPFLGRGELDAEWSGFAAVFDYTESFEDADEGRTRLAWLRSLLRPHAPLLFRGLGLALVVSALQMIFPVFTQIIVDRMLVEQDVDLLNALVATMSVVVLFMFAALYVRRYLLSFAAVRIDASSLDQLTRRLLSLPMKWFNRHRTGDIQRRLDSVRRRSSDSSSRPSSSQAWSRYPKPSRASSPCVQR
jgi:ABC-type bacteriocin/lantibiotic exporter with double-glycine peptidase domain